jgi:ribonuclease Z
VKLLALTHISARYAGSELRAEARAIFPACELPRDFDTIDIPLGDRGAPTLIRFGEAPKAPI